MALPSKHAALQRGNNAVITGGANGIGLAAAAQFLQQGMNVVIADKDVDQLQIATKTLRETSHENSIVESFSCDVSDIAQVSALQKFASQTLGDISVLMNNAGSGANPGKPWENNAAWKQLIDVNFGGVLHGVQAFVPHMLAQAKPGLIINTGSKQGITRPPGNSAYNLSKAAVISYTESLAYEFRQMAGCTLTAHLLVPGFTYTGMISRFVADKPDAAWTSEQVIAFMLERLTEGDFYILCPDNDVTPEMDAKRIQWYADDLIKNRPALSRWHGDYEEEFAAFMSAHRP